jgi:heme oxygenase
MHPTDTDAAEDTGIAARLRAATDAAHRDAESSAFITDLIGGKLSVEGYAALVAQHYFIYEVLEQAAEAMRENPVSAPFLSPELLRMPALAADLAYLRGPNWRETLVCAEATKAYRARLTEIAFTWPAGFIAHHYTRYLGDLSGGAFVAKAMRELFAFPGDEGTRFYQFDLARGAFKRTYRAALDALVLTPEELERMSAEAVLAFRLNQDLFRELAVATQGYQLATP